MTSCCLTVRVSITLHIARGRVRVDAQDALNLSYPLSCMFCCPQRRSQDPVEGVYEQMNAYFADGIQAAANPRTPHPGVREAVPPHIRALLDAEQGPLPDLWDREFAHVLAGIGSIMVFDLRE